MLISLIPSAFAAIPGWAENNVVFSGTLFGTNGYYNVISKKDYTLVPGAATETEMVLNNAAGSCRQVLHIAEVDPSNPEPEHKEGIVNGVYYENNTTVHKGVIKIGDDYYYVESLGRVAKGTTKWIGENWTNGLLEKGNYVIDENGKIIF
ncbi:MAG: hypothetical protein IKF53_06685 [Clostridia bacterium]|nr:hypothetical protein [Clostridia bacterium]